MQDQIRVNESYSLKLPYDEIFLNIDLHKKADIKIIKNGEDYHNVSAKSFKMKLVESGKYRVEGIIKDKGYFYSNPINVI